MNPLLTFVTPVAPYHTHLIEQVRATVAAQTVACEHVVIMDADQRGAGWARNRGLEQVVTPFVSFLDCDDGLEPNFAEACLRAYNGRRYVFTDWTMGEPIQAPDCPWKGDGSWHPVTTLLPTVWVKHVGGFDEDNSGEDTLLYWTLTRAGLCGKRLPEALFHYTPDGRRGREHVHSPDYQSRMTAMLKKFEDKAMACCQDEVIVNNANGGQSQPGDVLAQILFKGGRSWTGSATGRLYTKFGNAHQVYMNPADIDAQPQWFARVVDMPLPVDEAGIADMKALSQRWLGGANTPPVEIASPVTDEPPTKPNVRGVLGMYKATQALEESPSVNEGADEVSQAVVGRGLRQRRPRRKRMAKSEI